MKIIFEPDAGQFNAQELFVSHDQFNELVVVAAISNGGYWLLGEQEWELLAIGLNQEPGGYDLELELEARLQ